MFAEAVNSTLGKLAYRRLFAFHQESALPRFRPKWQWLIYNTTGLEPSCSSPFYSLVPRFASALHLFSQLKRVKIRYMTLPAFVTWRTNQPPFQPLALSPFLIGSVRNED